MSHELRTPLNSILVLGQQLSDNPDGNLTPKQVEFSRTIHGAGTDLLNLITDILDLSKIESGTVSVEADEVFFASLLDTVQRPFRHEAENRRLDFEVHTDPHLARSLVTDSKRLQQVLKNLLSNAFKFTEQGGVVLSVSMASGGWSEDHPVLGKAGSVIAFEVTDTGIGIPSEKQTDHLRGVPAGGCRHQPQVRRHRSGTGDQPRIGQPARRRNSVAKRARAKEARLLSTCRRPMSAPRRRRHHDGTESPIVRFSASVVGGGRARTARPSGSPTTGKISSLGMRFC